MGLVRFVRAHLGIAKRAHRSGVRVGVTLPIEALERRALLASVSCTGGALDELWTSPDNWSTGQVPGAADDVTVSVDDNPAIVLDSSQRINSLITSENLRLNGATLTVLTGVTLVDGAVLSISSSAGASSALNFEDGSQSLSGDGQVVFDGAAGQGSLAATLVAAPAATLTIGSGVSV